MANTSSAKKAARKIEHRTTVNTVRRTRMRTFVRAVEEAISAGDAKTAASALQKAEPEIVSAGQRGLIHRKAASRKVSRLTKRVQKLAK